MRMAGLERNYRKRKKRADLQRIVLTTVAAAGVLSAAVLAPNALVALGKLGLIPTARQTDSIRAARNRLVKAGFLEYQEHRLRLTKRGEKKLRLFEIQSYRPKRPKRWDKRWRVLIFDIPESRRIVRHTIRAMLANFGFVRLQDSVWVFPYDCEDFIVLIKAELKIGRDMLYLIVDTLEDDNQLRKKFDLQ